MASLAQQIERGEACYTIPEVAFYAKMHPMTVRRWFFDKDQPTFRSPSICSDEETLLSFTDFVEAVYVRTLRKKYSIPMKTIRIAVNAARNLNVEHPFAHPDFRTVIQGKSIHIREKDNLKTMVELAPSPNQTSSIEILHDYINDIQFDDAGEIIKYYAHRDPRDNVIVTPEFNFGSPMLEECKYTAETLWNAKRAEGSVANAARVYGVDESAVQIASDYYEGLLNAA